QRGCGDWLDNAASFAEERYNSSSLNSASRSAPIEAAALLRAVLLQQFHHLRVAEAPRDVERRAIGLLEDAPQIGVGPGLEQQAPSRRSLATAVNPLAAARWSGLLPPEILPTALTSAPALIKSRATSAWPVMAAEWSGARCQFGFVRAES